MARAAFPSRSSPALPAFSLDAPADWEIVPLSGVLLALGSPAAPGTFRPSITVMVQREVAGTDLGRLADLLLRDIRSATGDVKLAGDWHGQVAGQPARWQEFAFVEPMAGTTLFQVQVSLFAPPSPDAGVKDLVQIHGTCAGRDAAALHQTFRDTISSLRFGGG
jgi:hypothetical protein